MFYPVKVYAPDKTGFCLFLVNNFAILPSIKEPITVRFPDGTEHTTTIFWVEAGITTLNPYSGQLEKVLHPYIKIAYQGMTYGIQLQDLEVWIDDKGCLTRMAETEGPDCSSAGCNDS